MYSEVVGELKDELVYVKHMHEGFVDVVGPPSHDRSRNCVGRARGLVAESIRQMDSLTQVENSSR
jgi:hypothetical protein